jgi:hypothetical protein
MAKRIILALWALCFASVSIAQTFPKPPDVPAFSQVAPVYKTDGTANVVLDSTVTPMPIGSGLTNIPVPSTTGRITTTTDQTEHVFTASQSGTVVTVSAFTSGGPIAVGDYIYASGMTTEKVTSLGTSTGGVGTVNVDTSQTLTSRTMGGSNSGSYCLSSGYGGPTPQCGENKFRTIIGITTIQPDDPQRNYGQPGASHPHQFFGGGSCNAYSTYKSLRTHALNSAAAGTDLNGTCYWFPALEVLNPYGDSKNYFITADWVTVYYVENPATNGTGNGAKAHIPVGNRYVFGFDMDATWSGSPQQYSWLQTILNSANTTIGHTRYSLTDTGGNYNSQVLYVCAGGTGPIAGGGSRVLVNGDGSDPWGGTCEPAVFTGSVSGTTLTVSSMTSGTILPGMILSAAGTSSTQVTYINSQLTGTTGGVGTYNLSNSFTISSETMRGLEDFTFQIDAPPCYDGANLWSPGGYKNVIPQVWDNDQSTWTCPSNYYRIPNLRLEIHFTQYGASDRSRWDLSSDIAYRAKFGLTKAQLPPGTTFHTDWMDGWDHANGMTVWQDNCLGTEHHTGHQCNSSQISPTQRLTGGAAGEGGAGGRSVQVMTIANPHLLETDPGWKLIPPAWSGGMSGMHIHN